MSVHVPVKKISLKGFTLVELMVSITVMLIIIGITLSGGPQSISRVKLADDVYRSELMLREIQLQGSAVNSLNGVFGGAGVFFDRATSTEILKFKDKVDISLLKAIGTGNGLYDSNNSEVSDVFMLATKNKIVRLCVATSSPENFSCNSDNLPIVNTLTVSFSRPKQTAHIYINGATTTDFISACVQFEGPQSITAQNSRSLLVYQSGMITKKNGTCN
jgi:prepilin-type N-terminal cleavage/methylation domain-containing protein